jgi:hypothetical protein
MDRDKFLFDKINIYISHYVNVIYEHSFVHYLYLQRANFGIEGQHIEKFLEEKRIIIVK